jgi:hypothetical protein
MKALIKLFLFSSLVAVCACGGTSNQETSITELKAAAPSSKSFRKSAGGGSIEFVAGLAPNQRPAGAPVIRDYVMNTDRRTRSVKGISEPASAGFEFIDSQGAWYTPFNRPGMPGYYDLRNWHLDTRNSSNMSR